MAVVGSMTTLPTPRHAHVPDIGMDNNMLFEAMAFIFSMMVLCLQYINLYKTVWWLPHSNAHYALNFYMINVQLFGLLMIIMCRRFCYSIFEELQRYKSYIGSLYWVLHCVSAAFCLFLIYGFLCCCYDVVLEHSIIYSLFLCYPLITYFILFRFDLKPFFGKLSVQHTTSLQDKDAGVVRYRGRGETPVHTCSTSPEGIRDEVELFKTDFNGRIKQILFDSMLCAYYMGCVPLCFAQCTSVHCQTTGPWHHTVHFKLQNTLHYDMWWVTQHVCLAWLTAFILFSVRYLPLKYLSTLHRSSLHLGRWSHVEGRSTHIPYSAWSELQVWQQGVLVKHVKGLFKAEGCLNAAEPGNTMHSRFYFMFHQPLRVVTGLLCVTCVLIGYQFLQLVQATEWSHVLSLAFLLFSNYYSLFKLARDRLILSRSYKDEVTG